MKRLIIVLSIVSLPTSVFAGIQHARTGPGARTGSADTSVGAVFEMATVKPPKGASGDDQSSSALLLDANIPLGPAPVRVRVPFLLSGPEGSESGLGNVAVGVAKGLELGMGIDTALSLGIDVMLPTQGNDKVVNLSAYRGSFPRSSRRSTPTPPSPSTPRSSMAASISTTCTASTRATTTIWTTRCSGSERRSPWRSSRSPTSLSAPTG